MRIARNGWLGLGIVCTLAALVSAGVPGTFRGKVVEDGQRAPNPSWIYVQGRNGSVRRVEISHARIEYDDGVPASSRLPEPANALIAGAEVRVTAEQGSDGEWHASRVEILKVAVSAKHSALSGRS